MILLNEKETDLLWEEYEKNDPLQETPWEDVVGKATFKKVVEYIDKNFYIGVDCNGDIVYEGDYMRWQALLKEVE